VKRIALPIGLLLTLNSSPVPALAGTFSVMTYNVRGLPSPPIEDRTAQIAAIAPLLEDFHTTGGQYDGIASIVLVQELFDQSYYDTLTDPQTVSYPFITDKDVTPGLFDAPLGNGLNRLSDIAFTGHTRTKWISCYGTLGAGASDCDAPKGFDYARHEVTPGVFVDIYDLHADAGQDPDSQAARRDNISQLITAINDRSPEGTAVIVTGDTNSVYTRTPVDNIDSILPSTGVKDVWVELVHGGVVPPAGPDVDTGCDTDPAGADCELIDKVFYRSGVDVTLTPTSYAALQTLFQDNVGQDLSDHIPIVVTFDFEVNGGTTTTTIAGGTTTTVAGGTTTTISGVTTTTTSGNTTSTSVTTSTTVPVTGACADPVSLVVESIGAIPQESSVTASDALFVLRTAVGSQTCALCLCDVDGGGSVTATDALLTLKRAVGQSVPLNCPACV
jgi:hypothetical protein